MLNIRDLSVEIKKKRILRNLSFTIEGQKITAVLGKNGSGKSTLVSCINHTKKYEGEIFFENKNLKSFSQKERARTIAVLGQSLTKPHIKVEELVLMGRNPHLELGHKAGPKDQNEVERALAIMGITDLRERYIDEISGGERQKAYLAMIIAQNTPVLILDEPTTYLDVEHQADFMKALKKLKNEHKKTILVVMHDINLAMEYADCILVLDEGEMIFAGNKEECIQQEVTEKNFNLKKYQIEERTVFLA